MSAEENNGLTLESVAQRLEALERENAQMRSENDVLRSKVATMEDSDTRRSKLPALRGSDTGWTGESERKFEGKVSRRAMLSKAGAAAVAAVAAGTLLDGRLAHAAPAPKNVVFDLVTANVVSANFMQARTPASDGRSDTYASVLAENAGDAPAIHGSTIGSGAGVLGESSGQVNVPPGIKGISLGGIGGEFDSLDAIAAQLRLVPAGSNGGTTHTGHPTSGAHKQGEIYMDSAAALFVCVSSGSPGTWVQVTTTQVP